MATRIVMVLLALTLALVIACGGAPAAPVPTATSPAAPASDAAPTTAPTAPVASDTAQPTSTPQPAAPPAEVEVNPGKLTIMVGDFGPERFDTVLATGGQGNRNYAKILNGFLISSNEKREMVPGIASDWSLSDDGLTWTFTIREGVKFHDGSDLTVEDALWSLQHYFGPQAFEYALGGTATVISRAMDRIELSGPDEVSLTTKQPRTDFAFVVSDAGDLWYAVMPKRATLHDTEEEEAYDRNPIGAGFMRLVNHVPASMMSFERFGDYYYQPANGFPEDRQVNFQLLDMFLVPEEATRVAAIRSGEADIAPASLATKEQVEAGGGRLVFGQEGVVVEAKLMGCWEPQYPCHDKRVRQALHYAIDKELIRDRLYGGPEAFQVKGWFCCTPTTIGYTPELDPWPFDPEKARQLLEDAGYPGGQGFGKLIVNTEPSTAMPFQIEAAQLAAENWRRELGLDVEVRVGDATGNTKMARAGELNGQIHWKDNETGVDAIQVIDSRYADPVHPTRVHEDPELLRLVQETILILDPDERAEASKKLYLRMRDESYHFGIGYANIPWGVGPRVLTWEPYPMAGIPPLFIR